MIYIKVKWIHEFPDEPILLYSELDEKRWEKRKVDFFADGTTVFASENESQGNSGLSIEPLPPIEEIASDLQFQPEEISAFEFEEVWVEAQSNFRKSAIIH